MNITNKLGREILYFDGAMGSMLQSMGLATGELPERWNVLYPERIIKLHSAYIESGCNIIKTNTFGANRYKFSETELVQIIKAAVNNAKTAKGNRADVFVALDIGPLGKLLSPMGDVDFEYAVSVFSESIKIGVSLGVDAILIETMSDTYELKAAVLAAKENSSLPVFVTVTFDGDGRLLTGADIQTVVALLEGLGVDALGVNCGLGPRQMSGIVSNFIKYSSIPVIVNPNAGLPHSVNGSTAYDINAEEFAQHMRTFAENGTCLLGGCCGTTPEHIALTVQSTKNIKPQPITKKNKSVITSYTHSVEIGKLPVIIGERLNPTGKPQLKAALSNRDFPYLLRLATEQEENNAHILDLNVGLPGIDECEMLCTAMQKIQGISDTPLSLDSSNYNALEAAARRYNGKPLINSVCGKIESMERVFPIAKKYGAVVIALLLDEDGIPDSAEGRFAIAERLIEKAEQYGLSQKDLIFDALTMPVSANKNYANITLETMSLLEERLSANTCLGVSNISFGLPMREVINTVFFARALEHGLDAAIINPNSDEMMKVYYSYLALNGKDDSCLSYIDFVTKLSSDKDSQTVKKQTDSKISLKNAIIKGLKEESATLTKQLLLEKSPMQIIDEELITALDFVGNGFEKKTIYLPMLLMSADAASAAFEVIRNNMLASGTTEQKLGKIILATVEGDIHDIGKNIVKVLLQNYNFDVIDLGKNVPPQAVLDCALKNDVRLIGLSALMTTTVDSMEKTIKLLRGSGHECKIMVGGAVLTEEYAKKIGADKYSCDAMEGVRYAQEILC